MFLPHAHWHTAIENKKKRKYLDNNGVIASIMDNAVYILKNVKTVV